MVNQIKTFGNTVSVQDPSEMRLSRQSDQVLKGISKMSTKVAVGLESLSAVNRYFEFALVWWDGKFTQKFGDAAAVLRAKNDWAETFEKHKVSLADVERVIAKVEFEQVDWPFSLEQFLKACEPNPVDFGYPSADKIWRELVNPYAYLDWRKVHLFSYLVAHCRDESLRHQAIVSAARFRQDSKTFQSKKHAVERVYLWLVRRAINGYVFKDDRPESVQAITCVREDCRQIAFDNIAKLRDKFSFLKVG